MSDIYCAKCGEPWDAYGVRHGDMEPLEARKFLASKGCPCCGFGTKCVSCHGTGKDTDRYALPGPECPTCRSQRKVLARRLLNDRTGTDYRYDYIPNVKRVPEDAERLPDKLPVRESRDGLFEEVWFRCWSCNAPPCPDCGGDGKLHVSKSDAEDLEFRALESDADASDEDPILIMNRRGF